MAKLVSVEDLRGRMGLQNIGAVNTKLDEALEAATVILSELLRTSFDAASYKDRFWIDPQEKPYPAQWVRFALTHGFVDTSATNVVARTSINFHDLDTQDAIAEENMDVLEEKGLVRIADARRLHQLIAPFSIVDVETYVQIEYDAGFAVQSEVYQAVPDWLKQLAYMKAEQIYACDQSTDAPKENYEITRGRLFQIAESHIRWFPSAIQPLS